MKIICKLRHVLIDINKTQLELSSQVGITPANMSKIARGDTMPKIDTALLIAHYCGKSIEEIWKIEGLEEI